MPRLPLILLPLMALNLSALGSDEPAPVEAPTATSSAPAALPQQDSHKTVEELTALVRKSVVVVTFSGRDGKPMALGSGFIISPGGLIATNMHVIGEARPITVKTSDGKQHEVTAIHAIDRKADLALIQIDAQDLPALPLGDSDTLQQGQDVVALGNPRGLDYSVVRGVVSGRREFDGTPMIQLAMPIEQGNSGGPLLDMTGRVHGILTLKSLVTQNLGFAVAINTLKPLIDQPNPIPMTRWLTIGALDPKEWTPRFGSRWWQRAGRIRVDGQGDGFGGRLLLISSIKPPEQPYEVAVTVKLGEEDGAAGLIFHSDGNEKHYGFYPSNGSMRFSRFDGQDVFSWQVLEEVRSPHWRPGDWNTLKVRVAPNRIQCYLNDELVIESRDSQYIEGRVGLAKFRETTAEFKGFEVGKEIARSRPDVQTVAEIVTLIDDISPAQPPSAALVDQLLPHADSTSAVLRDEAFKLEQQAERLRQLAQAVHVKSVCGQMAELLEQPESKVDLLHAVLLIARLDNEELEVAPYLREIDRMVEECREMFPADADEPTRLAALNRLLFEQYAFHGSRTDFYNRSNSYLNEVLDDREGLPIMLSALYMELAQRLGVKVVGVGLPGHFIVRHEPEKGDTQLIDPFDRGVTLTRAEAAERVESNTGRPFDEEYLRTQSRREILVRMVQNLMGVAQNATDAEAMLRYTELLVAMQPDKGEPRFMRCVVRYRTGRVDEALADADWLLRQAPNDVDLSRVQDFRQAIQRTQEALQPTP